MSVLQRCMSWFGVCYIKLRYDCNDIYLHDVLSCVYSAGTGVPMALGVYMNSRSLSAKSLEITRVTSVNEYCLEGVNQTHVPGALHFQEHQR
jgi:hypothetical protein